MKLARIGLMAKAELQSMQEELVAMVKPTTFADDGKAVVGFQLTLEGWKRAREIRKERGPGNQAFVAMWFHPAMDVPSTTALPRAGRHRPFAISRRSGRSQQQD